MNRMAMASLVGLSLLFSSVPSRAEFFANMQGGKSIEAQQASSQAFTAVGQVMLGLSTMELGDKTLALTQLANAVALLRETARNYEALSGKTANMSLEIKFPDALTELAQTMEVSAEKIVSVGDVLAITVQSLNSTADVLTEFMNDPTPDRFTALRKSLETLLRTGDLSSKLLQ